MSKSPHDQDAMDEIPLDADALFALREGFRQLETPTPASSIELVVRQELASGTDFDPLHRQIMRRIAWTGLPTVAAFLVVTGVLALATYPTNPANRPGGLRTAASWSSSSPISGRTNSIRRRRPCHHWWRRRTMASPTQVRGIENAPLWFRRPRRRPL